MTESSLCPPSVVLSYGMGADSTALLLRWITEPATRPCPLADLLVITAMTSGRSPAAWSSNTSCR